MKIGIIRITLFMFVLASLSACCKQAPVTDIIPKPNEMLPARGTFTFDGQTKVYTNLEGREKTSMLDYLKGYSLELTETANPGEAQSLNLEIVSDTTGLPTPESYVMEVSPKQITIRATNGAGIFYGVQSLLQSIQPDTKTVQAVVIKDSPRFPYRGLHLDVSRHFLDKEFIK